MKSSVILVGIVEDHFDYAQSIASALQRSPDISVAGIWEDGESALAGIPVVRPDVVLMDIQLPDISGAECIRRLAAHHLGTRFLIVSACEDDESVFNALQAGASGYLLKEEDNEALLRHIRETSAGDTPVSRAIVRKLIRYFHKQLPVMDNAHGLTRREEEIVSLLAEGKMYKEISMVLGIAMETTKKHIRNIYDKLKVQNKTECINKWRLSHYDLI